MADISEIRTTPTNDSKRRLDFSPLCSRSLSEDNILNPMAKRQNKKSFIEMLDSVSDDANDPEKLKARRIMQKKKTHLARSMLELKCRRVLPTLMRRKKILNAEQGLRTGPKKAEDKETTPQNMDSLSENKENVPQNMESLSDKVKVMKMRESCSRSARSSLIMIL